MKPLGTNVIVLPLYDPPTAETGLSFGAPGLLIPDSAKNPMSQQGIVKTTGPNQEVVLVGDHILFHPFVQHPFHLHGHEYLCVEARHIVGRLNLAGVLMPLPWDVVIKPEFPPSAGRPLLVRSLWIANQVFNEDVPCVGRIEIVGIAVTTVYPGQRVIYEPDVGSEVGLRQVWYVVPERGIVAVVPSNVQVTLGGRDARGTYKRDPR